MIQCNGGEGEILKSMASVNPDIVMYHERSSQRSWKFTPSSVTESPWVKQKLGDQFGGGPAISSEHWAEAAWPPHPRQSFFVQSRHDIILLSSPLQPPDQTTVWSQPDLHRSHFFSYSNCVRYQAAKTS